MTLVLVILLINGFVQGDLALIDVVTDAQSNSLQQLRRGQLSASLINEFPGKGTVRAVVRAVWDDEDVYYLIKVSDPDEVISRDGSYSLPLKESHESIGLIIKDNLTIYNPILNVLHLSKVKRQDALGNLGFLEVIPATNWGRCCPPWTSMGSSWSKTMRRKSPFHRDGSTIEIALDPNTGLVNYTRTDPGVGTYRLKCSMELGGNVVEHRFDSDGGDIGSVIEHLEWRKNANDAIQLTKREYEQFALKDNNKLEFRSTLLIDSFQVMKSRSPLLSNEYLKSQLPRNAQVEDHSTGKTYPLFANLPPDQELKVLSKQLKTGVFFKGK